jgi:hypothetical protein
MIERESRKQLSLVGVNNRFSETNVMQFLFSLLRIKDLYMFRALLAHPQEALHKQHLLYCVRVMSVGCTRFGVELVSPAPVPLQNVFMCPPKILNFSVK